MRYVKILLILLGLLLPATIIMLRPVKTEPSYGGQLVSFEEPNKYQCNRYGDPNSNFEVLSICPKDGPDPQGQYLSANIDNIKAWLLTRWAFPNDNFSLKCKVVITPNKEIYKELFGKDTPQYRIVREPTGQAKELTVWVPTDDPKWATQTLSGILTEVCLQEMEFKTGGKLGLWVHRGMPIVNGDLPTFRQKLGNLSLIFDRDIKVYWSKEILTMTPDILSKHPPESAAWFDAQSAAFLHMLFKEFGPRKFNTFLAQCRSGDPEMALRTVYGFNSYAECDTAFKAYMRTLSMDITGRGKMITPNQYLTWPVP